MRRLEITKATGCAALIGSGCAQLRREIEAAGPQQRRQRAGEARGRTVRRLEITGATGCAALIGSGCAQLRARLRPQGRSKAAQATRQHRRGHQSHARGRTVRRLEITKATGCAAPIGSGCAQLRARSRPQRRFLLAPQIPKRL